MQKNKLIKTNAASFVSMGQIWSDYWLKRRLRTTTKKNTRRYVPEFRWAKVVNVYDGDTVTLATFPGKSDECFLFRCRLARIDAPEMIKQSGTTKRARDRERAMAIKSRDALRKLIDEKIIRVQVLGLEKYGRVLAELEIDQQNVSDWMVRHKHAVPYDGGKKQKWCK